MAPGCSMSNDHTQTQIIHHGIDSNNLSTNGSSKNSNNQIPLPDAPAPKPVTKKTGKYQRLDTIDSFEILEQTIMKQKRLGKTKNTDLRMKILLKRTFNLVCELMDDENGLNSTPNDKENGEEVETIYTQENNNGDINIQETLIINLNESESLDSTFQCSSDEIDELNYIDLENFNYENLIENNENLVNSIKNTNIEYNSCQNLDKNKTFLTDDFFSDNNQYNSIPITWLSTSCNKKRRRSSADDDTDFEDFEEEESPKKNYYLLSDLTNKKRCISSLDSGSYSVSSKKFKESNINIVT